MVMPRYIKGDLFTHRGKGVTILAHACNPFGLWGGGIAAQFRKRFPYANELYAEHCLKNRQGLLGSCLLVPAYDPSDFSETGPLIACLFTSDFETPEAKILEHTELSIRSLAQQLESIPGVEKLNGVPLVNMPQINSGIFNVPWERTEAILDENRQLLFNVYTL